MRLYCIATQSGLIPYGDEEFEKKKELKIGQIYTCDVKISRNIKFHRKYFAMINCAWQILSGKQAVFNNNKDLFRKWVQTKAGYYDAVMVDGEIVNLPVSIGYDSLDGDEFGKLYERVREVLFETFLKHMPQEVFEKQMLSFY